MRRWEHAGRRQNASSIPAIGSVSGGYTDPMNSVLTRLKDLNPDALLLEPRLVYDLALIDVTDQPDDHWPRTGGVYVAVYDTEKCIKAIMDWFEVEYEEAVEWFSYNTSGAWVGEGTPTFR